MTYSRWMALGFAAILASTSAWASEGGNAEEAHGREAQHPELKCAHHTNGKKGMHVIGQFEKRDRIVTVLSGSQGRKYTVKSRDGKVLAEEISEKELLAAHPDLHRFVKSAMAGARDAEGFVDAAVRRPELLDGTEKSP